MKMLVLELVIEKAEDQIWGRVQFNDNLISDFASSISELESKITALLADFEGVDQKSIQFEHHYDIHALFQKFDFLNISKIAVHAGMNPSLLRQYASGIKNPSAEQAKKIEKTLRQLAHELEQANVFVG